ncbi:SusC/RagA family TonB-linked outer membrane protein [Sphingobacterium alkalisoli]|uniref:SusC/RagA family TonB-linked outer membrane protein n=1 Tax=Sphingobacterium alkalisoli TaxID=1874115 RepID=A0A4U0H4G1_9SPHI|nr:SusC/RagA family TonB-linked outer membrane protein [Sphingobacterium alkalisoli]TJY66587.1 SusC/RagA family TonB-linked outer membrane protein [Sphingobacterium alkalisoli]GGH15485.1 SusC/RagA family TonB-linked outer membrane protein [Sphingobacterium alkalisoli]
MKKNKKTYNILFALLLSGSLSLYAQESKDSLVNVAFGKTAKTDLLGGVSSASITEILTKSYGTYSLDNLESFVGGYTSNVWGQSPLILVDGVPRSAGDVRMVEVESVTVLKGASNVALYGSNAAKGVILITTKRGVVEPISIDVRANTGLYSPKRYPTYLNAAEYMTFFNEASRNDGISERYTAEQIYHTSTGENPYQYPDVDFYSSEYLKKVYSRSDLTTEISGGNERARYYTNLGLSYDNDILKYGDTKNNNALNFNVRANVDMNLTNWLTASTDAVAIVSDTYRARGDFWGAAATLRPNWFSPLVPINMFDPENTTLQTIVQSSNNIVDGQYLLGGTSNDQTNTFGDMLVAGYIKSKSRRFMFNVNANADLRDITQGLSLNGGYSLDYQTYYNEAFNEDYAVYQPTWSNIDGKTMITSLTKFNNDVNSTNEYIGEANYNQTMSFRAQLDYDRTFNFDHNINASLLGWGYHIQQAKDANHDGSTYQPVRNANLGLQVAYNYKHRYYVDFTGAVVHSAKLAPGNRTALSPTITLGWRISDETFFKENISFFDNLKLAASYGSLNQDIDISNYYMYQGYFVNDGGWYQWRDGVAGGWTTGSRQGENLGLSFIKRNEFRIGLDAAMFNNLITVDANYFRQDTRGLLTQGSTIFPSYFSNWDFSFLPYLNYNNDRRSGVDYSVNLNHKVGELNYSVGLTGMYFSSRATQRDEVYEDDYQYRSGKALDAYWGYISEGIFMNQAEIDNHARQTFGEVLPGDIKYRDVNNDGLIDSRDQVELGQNGWAVSPFTYGVNVTLKWKNVTLFALGNGQSGAIGFNNTAYHWIRGSSKYSDVVLDRTTIEKNTAGEWEVDDLGSYPRLTTTSNSNNFLNSTYWMYKNNRFNLSRVQLTYDFDKSTLNSSFLRGLSIYANGDNLLVISKESKMMETNIGSAPQYRFYNIGFKASF